MRCPHSEREQFSVALVLSHGLIAEVISPDVHLHLDLLQVQQEVKTVGIVPHLQGTVEEVPGHTDGRTDVAFKSRSFRYAIPNPSLSSVLSLH